MERKWLRQRALEGELLSGCWVVLGSSLTAEICGRAGFDWVILDLEHGMGDLESLLYQLQAMEGTPAVPLVRIAWNQTHLFKRVLDLGPSGVMVPWVNSAEEASQAVRAMRYPPQGVRGVTPLSRPGNFGQDYQEYFDQANDKLLTIVQIETPQAVENVDEIAAVDGVDVLFVGPMDLSINMGIAKQFDHPRFREALAAVLAACRRHGKAAGILLLDPDKVKPTVDDGFTFVGLSSDGGELATAMNRLAKAFDPCR